LENRLCHQIFVEAAAVLDDWPSSFHRFCRDVLASGTSDILPRSLDRLADWPGLEFLRVALEEQAEDESNSELGGFWLPRRFIAPEQARAKLRVSIDGFASLVDAGLLRVARSVADAGRVLVDDKSVQALLSRRAELVDVDSAAASFDISVADTLELISNGYLEAVTGPTIDDPWQRR
ncbi:MAG: hypothetical protein ACREAC_33035, partial [Blastocatellia bacterium]